MNYLNRLIKEFCPHGVTYLKLENFLKIKNGGIINILDVAHIPFTVRVEL